MTFTPSQPMRALSWKQPFAELMLHGKVETRTWNTNYRGWVLICASKAGYNEQQVASICGRNQFLRVFKLIHGERLYFGTAIAIGRLMNSRRMTPADESSTFVKYQPGLYCHIYTDVQMLPTPIEWRGSQGWRTLTFEMKTAIYYNLNGIEPDTCCGCGNCTKGNKQLTLHG